MQGSMPDSYTHPSMIPPQREAVVSLMFGPSSEPLGGRIRPDFAFITSDSVLFYVDEKTILRASKNNFSSLLPLNTLENIHRVVYVDLHSTELQVILQVIYDVSYDSDNPNPGPSWQSPSNYPDVKAIIHGIDLLPHFGIDPKARIHPQTFTQRQTKMFAFLLTCAPIYPLEIYTLAARHNMHDLAVSTSSHLLTIDLATINSSTVQSMGALYHGKLIRLLEDRKLILSNLLSVQLGLHDPTKKCGFTDQQVLKHAWARGVTSLTRVMNAGIPTTKIKEVLLDATNDVTCPDCIKLRDARVRTICAEWSLATFPDFMA
ncbi:hypothetical protein VNI00_008528 [Paramarasmius palmivorus]|uniref:BTB domain-containing protein n=1 Tax=Paramarasmius palmivorus TaxID=297713 RepID=A0AAW0CX22_9AGAR